MDIRIVEVIIRIEDFRVENSAFGPTLHLGLASFCLSSLSYFCCTITEKSVNISTIEKLINAAVGLNYCAVVQWCSGAVVYCYKSVHVMNLPLSFSPIGKTGSAEETEHLFSNEVVSSRILCADRQSTFSVEMNQVSVGRSTVTSVKHHSAYEISCGDIDTQGDVLLCMGFDGGSSTTFNGELVDTLNNAIAISRNSNVKHARTAGSCEILLKCQEHDLKQKLQTNLDRPITRELQFSNSVSMLQGIGAQARSTLKYIINSIDADPTVLDNPLIAANFEDLLSSTVLSIPNNYSDLLTCERGKTAAPAAVVLAEEYMDANAHLPITITDVLALVSCSKKSLYSNFRKFRQYTPNEFLVNSRLRLAHQRLENPAESDTVTSIAYNSGFSHMGRFSGFYRKRYGVKPSDTLRLGN